MLWIEKFNTFHQWKIHRCHPPQQVCWLRANHWIPGTSIFHDLVDHSPRTLAAEAPSPPSWTSWPRFWRCRGRGWGCCGCQSLSESLPGSEQVEQSNSWHWSWDFELIFCEHSWHGLASSSESSWSNLCTTGFLDKCLILISNSWVLKRKSTALNMISFFVNFITS